MRIAILEVRPLVSLQSILRISENGTMPYITLIGVITPETQQKLLKDTEFHFCKFPKKQTVAVARSGGLGTTLNLPPRLACSAFVQYCPLQLIRGEISQEEVCEFCRHAFSAPAMVCRPRSLVPRPMASSSTSSMAPSLPAAAAAGPVSQDGTGTKVGSRDPDLEKSAPGPFCGIPAAHKRIANEKWTQPAAKAPVKVVLTPYSGASSADMAGSATEWMTGDVSANLRLQSE